MANLWPARFEESDDVPLKTILEAQAKILTTITKDFVFAEVVELDDSSRIKRDNNETFAYAFVIKGNYLDNYRFTAFYFFHEITFYPVRFLIDEEIGKELEVTRNIYGRYEERLETPSECESFIEKLFQSERIGKIIGSIMRLSH